MDGWLYLNTFRPLVDTPAGASACEAECLPPFIDGSIRREPDFEHPLPVITCLCRSNRFAPRLRPGDRVAYMTTKAKYDRQERHWRFVAILLVERLFESHSEAASWFVERGEPLPNNLMVEGNPPNPLCRSHRRNKLRHLPEDEWHRQWDRGYRARARRHGRVVGCRPLFVDAGWTAPVVSDDALIAVFGRVPGTRNPGRHDLNLLPALARRLGLSARLCTL